jgi:hypothetical protein
VYCVGKVVVAISSYNMIYCGKRITCLGTIEAFRSGIDSRIWRCEFGRDDESVPW